MGLCTKLIVSALILILSILIALYTLIGPKRITTALQAMKAIYHLKEEDVARFMNSYELFQKDRVQGKDDEKLISDYYTVLNHLCAVGEVEKMYIPPVIDENLGVFDNQIEYEKKIMQYIKADKNSNILDLGCGRGKVAEHIATTTGARVTGINVDHTQINLAKQNAQSKNLNNQLQFFLASFNDPLQFEDNSFDGVYNIQAFSYAKNLEALFKEVHRVLKPGGRFSFLEWFVYDNYDPKNPEHVELMRKNKAIIGAVYNPTTKEAVQALEKAGFKVLVNENASKDGHQYSLIEKADYYFTTAQVLIKGLVKVGLLPEHFKTIFERLSQDADSFILGDKLGLWTSCHQILAEKAL